MNDLGNVIRAHFIHSKRGVLFVLNIHHAPSVGDELRFKGATGDIYFAVVRKMWAYDEPESPFSSLNIEITEAP